MKRPLYEFSQDGKSCYINEPATPRYWYNYLWNEKGYCAQVSQIGHGRSYYIDEKANMCQINNQSARYIYLRDERSGDFWNIGAGPLNEKVDDYRCIHSIGHSTVSSAKNGIAASWRIHVPLNDTCEVWSVEISNTSDEPRLLSMFSAVSFSMEGFSYPRYYEMYRCMETEFDSELNGIYCRSGHPFAPHNRYNAFLASSEPVLAYDGDLTAFCGPNSTMTMPDTSSAALFQRPAVVVEGLNCTNSEGALFILGAVLQNTLTLMPGETRRINLVFGVSESKEEACSCTKLYCDPVKSDHSLRESEANYYCKYADLAVKCPDNKINNIMNSWLRKQVDFCIVGKKGVRDNLQIAVALLNYRQDKAKEEILECLRHQFSDGHAVLTWYPYDDTRYSDQPFWIIWAVCELIKETGDYSLLDEKIEWQDGGSASVLDHVKAAVSRLITDKGRNGLIKIYFADWNDALNITTDPDAESVMLSHQFCLALRNLRELIVRTGDNKYAEFLREEYEKLKKQLNEAAWDGDWYVRALSKDGPIGSKDSDGSKIYINAQTWAVLADVADEEKLPLLINSVDNMEHDFGFPLNLPPYSGYSPQVGRMSGMLPGLFENGGVYCHATGFKLLMDCKLGRAGKALETLRKIMPDSSKNPSSRSGAEPYVFTNCYSTHPKYYGKSYQSWTTGTSAWSMMGLYEGILGIKRDYDGLRIDPCFPAEWESAEATRNFRGTEYHIIYRNPDHIENGIPVITIDGKELAGKMLPEYQDGKTHKVVITFK